MHFTHLGRVSTYVGFSMSKLSIVFIDIDTMNRRLEDDYDEVMFEKIMINYL